MNEIILVSLEIQNRHPYPVTKRLRRGALIEIADPGSDEQHAMVTRDYTITIPPTETVEVFVEAWCFVKRKTWPDGARGNLTPYCFTGLVLDQHDLWSQLGY